MERLIRYKKLRPSRPLVSRILSHVSRLNILSRPARFWPLLLAFSPAWLILALLVPLRIPVPYQDAWVFVRQYNDLCEGRYSWAEFFRPHNAHPSAVGKAIYFAVLEWAGGDVALLPLLTWLCSMVIALGVLKLSRPLWRAGTWSGAGFMFLANLAIFSASAGHAWIWDFVFQNVLPGMFLVLGLVALQSKWALCIRFTAALLCSVLAAFSFGSGFFVGLLLVPSVWHAAADSSRRSRTTLTACWTVAVLFAAWLALSYFNIVTSSPDRADGHLENLWNSPGMAVQYVLLLLGLPLGQGTVMEPEILCAVLGGTLVLVSGLCAWKLARERSAARWWEALPSLVLCGWAALNALLICYGRMRFSLNTAIAPRYVTFMLFFLVGVLMLAAVAWRTGDGAAPRMASLWKTLAPALVALLVAAHVTAWIAGHHHMLNDNVRMRQEKAAFTVAPVVAPLDDQIWWHVRNGDSLQWARALHARGRLRRVEFATSAEVSTFRAASTSLSPRWASWSLVRAEGDRAWLASGTCGLGKDVISMPDLILLSAQADGGVEKFFGFAKAKLPEDFMDRELLRRIHAEHYFGWERKISPGDLPAGASVTIRAYAYDAEARRVRALEGNFTLRPAAE